MLPALLDRLNLSEDWRYRYGSACLRYSSPATQEDWVFANPETGKPYWPGRIRERTGLSVLLKKQE
jgi:hypothetical protein